MQTLLNADKQCIHASTLASQGKAHFLLHARHQKNENMHADMQVTCGIMSNGTTRHIIATTVPNVPIHCIRMPWMRRSGGSGRTFSSRIICLVPTVANAE